MVRKKQYTRKEIGEHKLRPESLMMGYGYRPEWSEGSVKCPIFQTSTFAFQSAEEGKAFFELAYGLREQKAGERMGLIYSRLNNPDLEVLEDRLTLWDDAEAAAVHAFGNRKAGHVQVHVNLWIRRCIHKNWAHFPYTRSGFRVIPEGQSAPGLYIVYKQLIGGYTLIPVILVKRGTPEGISIDQE